MKDACVFYEKLLHVKGNHTVNIGNDDFIDIEEMAKFMCDYMGRDYSLFTVEELPSKMTLTKIASFNKLQELTNYSCRVDQKEGIISVIETVKEKLFKKYSYAD